jgi:hypothetical protein
LTLTRSNIAFPVNNVCQFLHSPTIVHWAPVKRILRYVRHTTKLGLKIQKTDCTIGSAFLDVDWAGSVDERRSMGGFDEFLGSNLISWSARKQHIVYRSNTEAEYKVIADITVEIMWVQPLLRELNILSPKAGVIILV